MTRVLLYVERSGDVIWHRWYCEQCKAKGRAPVGCFPVELRCRDRRICDGCGNVVKGN